MKIVFDGITEVLREEDATTAVEYAVLLTLAAVICVAGFAIAGVNP